MKFEYQICNCPNSPEYKDPNCQWCKDGKIKKSCPKCQPLRFQKERRKSKQKVVNLIRELISKKTNGPTYKTELTALIEILVECGVLQERILPKE